MQSRPPVILRVVNEPGSCYIELHGRKIAQDELIAAARSWRGRSVLLEGPETTPYKCIGASIYAAQRAGVERVDWRVSPKE